MCVAFFSIFAQFLRTTHTCKQQKDKQKNIEQIKQTTNQTNKMKRKTLLLLWLLAMMLAPRWGFAQDITLNQSQSIALTPGTTRNFYDSGGSSNNYASSENYTLTLTSPGDITINFSSFATESCSSCYDWDYMYIYDGTTSGTQLAKGQTDCSSANLTTGTNYTATSGTMTITWKSDGSTNAAGWVATITAASVPGLVPFVDGLETSTWYTVNGSCTNQWYLGSPGARYGTAGLYISNDDGTTNAYSTGSVSVVYAYKNITFPSAGKYNLSFDIKQKGESSYDCVGAMLYNSSTTPSASTTSAGSGLTSFPAGYTTMITGVGNSFSGGEWKTSSTDFTVTEAGQYKLTFCWKNDGSGGTQPPAAIDNVIVSKVNDVTAVTSPDGTGSMTASLTWNFDDGTYQGWNLINNDGDNYCWMTLGTLGDYTSSYNPSTWAHNGSGAVLSGSFINGIGALSDVDNYLVSPRLILGGSISFYAKSLDGDYPEQFGVAVCTSDNPIASNFTTIQTWTGASDTDWHLYTVDLSAYTDYGYVAIRNYGTTDQYLMIVDDITLTSRSVSNFNRPLASGVSATFNVTPNSGVSFTQWTNNGATVSTSNSYTFTVQEPSALVAVMDVPATVPYTQDFESADHGWAMINGSCANKWYCGAPGGKSGGNGLYISSDNGTNNTYNNSSPTYVYTYKSLTFSEAGDYILLFDLRQQGESTWDCVGAMLYSSSTTPSPSTSYGSSGLDSWPSGYSQFIVGAGVDASGGNWAKISQTFTLSTAGTYKLVFGWKNDSSSGTNPPAAIDNVIVKKIPTYYNVDASANPSSAGNVKFLVGDGGTTTNTYLPCYTLYNYNLTQQIYTPQEIGNVGTINSIAFYNGGDTKTLSNLDFYMVHTVKDQFGSSTDWIPVTANDLVYSGTNVEMTAGQWTIINLTTPFVYDGLSNLAIITDEYMSWSGGLACRVFTPASGGNCSIRVYSDGTDYDPTNPTYTGTLMTVKNQILVNPGGSLTRSFPEGATVTLVEELTNSDYHFENWTDNSSNAGNNEIYTISNLAGAHTVVANYAPNTHTLTASVNPANSGTISDGNNTISGATTYNHGTSVTLTATPNTGYDFIGWMVDGLSVGITNPTTVTMDQDHSVVANFELQSFTVTVLAEEGGTATGGGNYNYGATATLTATPDECHDFSQWIDENGGIHAGSNPIEITVDHDITMTAQFTIKTYIISVTAGEGGNASGSNTYDCNESCTVTAEPAPGYTFDGWYENNTLASSDASYTFTVTAARTLEARFSLNYYTITVSANPAEGGTVSQNVPSGSYQHSQNCIVTATPAATYAFVNWTENGTIVSTDAEYSFTVTADRDLVANFELATVTITKEITGHQGGEGNWYLLTSPLNTAIVPTAVTNMVAATAGDYDLFYFDQTASDGLEWRNYKQASFSLVPGTGYLYANKYDVTLTYSGVPYQGDGTVPLTYSEDNESEYMWGLNLVGNPYHDAQAEADCETYYAMKPDGSDIIVGTSYIVDPMEAIIVRAAESQVSMHFWRISKGNSTGKKRAGLALNVTQGRSLVDRAVVRFDATVTLPKFQLNANHTKIYIPQDDKDYAVVYAESNIGEMPVNFKAEKNGTYTIGVNAEEVSFGYLHLIDNKTGADVDLLAMPSYTFDALTTDYASRFKLVFATGSSANSGTFAFYSNGSFVISNDGEAVLQVIDVNGRIVKSETVHGCASVSVNAAPGVYMLRLVNGESERVQKVVVR